MSHVMEDPRLLDSPAGQSSAEASGRAMSVGVIAVAAGLLCIGAVMTFSASATTDRPMIGWEFWKFPAIRQLIFVAGGLVSMLVVSRVPYRLWSAGRGLLSMWLLGLSLLALAMVFVPGIGVEVNGANRWVQLGPASLGLRFQPSEMVKIALPIFLANWIIHRVDISSFMRGFVPTMGVIGFCVLAVALEDFGTAILIGAVAFALLMVAGARWWHLLLTVLPAVPVLVLLIMTKPHRVERLMAYRNIWADPEGSGYQVIQSLCTIASGGWWGRGLGRGFVKGYLPEARTDFIFAVICEELGMVGAAAVIGLFIVLMWQGRNIIRRCVDPVGQLIAFAVALTLGVQAAMNIAVVTVSVPTKGISLPLVSAGGSGVLFLGAMIGMLANIARTGAAESRRHKAVR